MDDEDLGEIAVGVQENTEVDPLMRETGEVQQAQPTVQVVSIAQKCTKGLQLMEVMGFKDRGSFSKTIGGMHEQSSDEDEEQLLLNPSMKPRDVKRESKQFNVFKKDTFGLGYVATTQDKEMQRLQEQKAIQAHKPFRQG